jgi:hypothetical protein
LALIVLFVVGVSVTPRVQAILTVVDDPVFGAGSLVLDTDTDLEWLRLDRPENFSVTWDEWDAAMTNDALYATFHFGTSAEIRALWDHGSVPADTGPTNVDYSPEIFDAIISFVDLIGGFHRPDTCDSTSEVFCQVQPKAWRDEAQSQAAFAVAFDPPNSPRGTVDSVGAPLPDTHLREAWIARAVPEPSLTLLQGVALGTLTGIVRLRSHRTTKRRRACAAGNQRVDG